MSAPKVFLDANVIFSSALGGEVFDFIREIARRGSIRLITSEVCVREALENLVRKRPGSLESFDSVLLDVEVYPIPATAEIEAASAAVGPSDAHVLAAAMSLGCEVLITGDLTHFGHLMDRRDLPLLVLTPRAFLLRGPN